jgi:hypothetical protein
VVSHEIAGHLVHRLRGADDRLFIVCDAAKRQATENAIRELAFFSARAAVDTSRASRLSRSSTAFVLYL